MKRIVVELVIKPSLLFYRSKDEIGAAISKYLVDWETNALKIELYDKKEKIACYLEHKRLAIVCEDVKNDKKFFEFVDFVLDVYTSKLKLTDILRIGIRYTYLQKTTFKYPELVSLTQDKFYPKSKEVDEIIGKNISDTVFSVDFNKEGFKFHYLVGPVHKEEAVQRFSPSPKLEVNQDELSDIMIYLDVDGYKDSNCKAEELRGNIQSIRKLVHTISQSTLSLKGLLK